MSSLDSCCALVMLLCSSSAVRLLVYGAVGFYQFFHVLCGAVFGDVE